MSAPALRDKVALVLLTHNCAHRLDRVLDRVCALGIRVIAVDNASRDDTVAVLRRRPGVEVVRLAHNVGAAARNLGLEYAGTPYVAFCDDDSWYAPDAIARAVAVLERYPRLALVNARITVGDDEAPDPISVEMAASPLPERDGVPGAVLLGFMAGAVIVRSSAYLAVGGYDERFFLGGEEETLAVKLVKQGWLLRYRPDVVVHHEPSVANAPYLRSYGLRNTIWNAWLHRRFRSAARWTAFVLADAPKTDDWWRGLAMIVPGLPWVLRHRQPMSRELDQAYRRLDERRFAQRRPFWNRTDPLHAYRYHQRRRTAVAPGSGAARSPQRERQRTG